MKRKKKLTFSFLFFLFFCSFTKGESCFRCVYQKKGGGTKSTHTKKGGGQ